MPAFLVIDDSTNELYSVFWCGQIGAGGGGGAFFDISNGAELRRAVRSSDVGYRRSIMRRFFRPPSLARDACSLSCGRMLR